MTEGLLNDIRRLLRPRTLPLLARGRARSTRGGGRRLLVLAAVGALFWAGLFALSFRVLRYFKGIEDIGDLLAYKLLAMILMVSFALMLFSSVLTSLSRLYLSRDLDLVHAMPVPSHRIFIARWLDGTVESSWMVVVFTAPVFLAYGVVFDSGPAYYALTPLAVGLLAVVASALSAAAVTVAVMVVPATRMRSVVLLMGVLLFVVLYLAVRLSRPEQLVNPEVFDSVLLYLTELQAPAAPYLPSTWVSDAVQAALKGAIGTSLFHLALAGSAAAALVSTARAPGGRLLLQRILPHADGLRAGDPRPAAERASVPPPAGSGAGAHREGGHDLPAGPDPVDPALPDRGPAGDLHLQLRGPAAGALAHPDRLPAEPVRLPQHGAGALRADRGDRALRLPGRQPGARGLLADQGLAGVAALFPGHQVLHLLPAAAAPDRGPGRRDQPAPEGDAVYDGALQRDRVLPGAGDRRDRHRPRGGLPGFQGREPHPDRDELRRARFHDHLRRPHRVRSSCSRPGRCIGSSWPT